MTPAEFTRLRKVCARRGEAWGKAMGLGAASATLVKLLVKSCHKEPWAWTEAVSMERMADEFSMSRRNLFYHLAKLEEAGMLIRTVRVSAVMRKTDTEFPVYQIHSRVPYEIDYWASNSGSESARFAPGECKVDTPHKVHTNESTPVAPRLPRPSDPLVRGIEEEGSRSNNSVLRTRHLKAVPDLEVEVDVRPPRGETGKLTPKTDAEKRAAKKEKPTGRVPSSRLAVHFEERWLEVLASKKWGHALPSYPWNIESKTRFYRWANEILVPACGTEEVAHKVIDLFCADVEAGRISLPPQMRSPVFTQLGRNLDQLVRRYHQTETALGGGTVEEADADLERRREENRAAARRRAR